MIVAVGLYIPGTGFTRVFDTLFSILGHAFDIHWLGIAYKGPVLCSRNYTLYPNNVTGGDMFGAYASADLARDLQADSVLFLNDVWIFKNYRDTHQGRAWKTIAYIPVDGTITDTTPLLELAWLDQIVAYHFHSSAQLSDGFESLLSQGMVGKIPKVSSIYHGVDTTLFSIPGTASHHQDWRLPYKRAKFGHLNAWQSAVFLLNANRFNARKDLRTTIEGFAQALSLTNRKLYLCLHLPGIEPFQRDILGSWIAEFDCQDAVVINPLADNTYTSEYQLAELYRACDIGINTTLGEGWGFVSFEHAACGAVQILPRHSALEEIWNAAAEYITLSEPVQLPSNPFLMHRASASHLARTIARLCDDPEYLRERSLASFTHVQRDVFNWQVIAGRWKDLLLHRH